jgi:hypothetical protein
VSGVRVNKIVNENMAYEMAQTEYIETKQTPWKILIFFLAVHSLMLIYDSTHPGVFFHADRAYYRWDVSQGFVSALTKGEVVEFLSSNGLAGDYLFHGLLFFLGGRNAIIIFQVFLALLSGYAVYRIAQLIGLKHKPASVASTLYLALPHTLIYPHQIASEALHCPLLVISLWLIARFWDQKNAFDLVGSSVVLSLATFIRPITLLWPFVPAAVLLSRKKAMTSFAYLLLAFVPMILWFSFMLVNTGHLTFGESNRDMGHNLYQRIWRMSDAMDATSASSVRAEFLNQGNKGVISLPQYLHFVAEYPGAFISHALRDTFMFSFKSGIERITIDYLEIDNVNRKSFQDKRTGWRHRLEKDGVVSTLIFMWKAQGLILLVSLIGAVFMTGLTLLAFWGALRMIVEWRRLNTLRQSMAVLLIALPLYIWLFSQVVDAVVSRHRAPAESAIVLLAVYGAVQALDLWQSRRQAR